MPTQSNDNLNLKPTTIVNAFVSPPLPNWEQLRDLPEPSGPIPEDDEDDAIGKEEALKPREVKGASTPKESKAALKSKEVKEVKESEQRDKGEK